jgi:hypothetical protein
MPAPSADFKKALKRLTEAEKETLLLRAVRRDAELYDTYRYELLDDVTLASLQADTEDQLHELFNLSVSGYQLHKALPKALSKALKEVARARRITKSKQLEIDLQLYLLKLILRNYSGSLNSSHASFYKATARLAVRTATMVLKNLHEDYWSEYKSDLDDILSHLRTYDNRWQLSFELPAELTLPH